MVRLQARYLTKPIKPRPKLEKKKAMQIEEKKETESVELLDFKSWQIVLIVLFD